MRKRMLLLFGAVALTGCGAILHGSRQKIAVESSPSGARVETAPASGVYTTPATINLERKNSYVLTFTAPGYVPATFNIQSSIGTGTVVADVLLTGLIGVIIDGITGSWYGLSPETASVTLTRTGGSEHDADAIHIAVGISTSKRAVTVSSASPLVSVNVSKR